MREKCEHFCKWYWQERSGVILFRSIRGARRLSFELPLMLVGGYIWYLYLFSLPNLERHWLFCLLSNPFGIAGILSIVGHEIGINYMRQQLSDGAPLTTRMILCIPGRVIAPYKQRFGADLAVKLVRYFRLAAVGASIIGMILCNGKKIF